MFPMTVAELAKSVNGRIVTGEPQSMISSISTDSRNIRPGDFFIPIAGNIHNGHSFIEAAADAGASGWLTEYDDRNNMRPGKTIIRVSSSLDALQSLGRHVRRTSRAKVVAITGSTGKTTTRMLFESIARHRFRTVAAPENFNNEIGVPLTLLMANRDTELIITEMAMRGLGQIADLCEIARPDIGCITNIGKTHYQLLGSEENIGKAKGEMAESLSEKAVLALNQDDAWTQTYRRLSKAKVITYGLTAEADIRADNIELVSGRPRFDLRINGKGVPVELGLLGRHNVYNALAAATISIAASIDLADIAAGLGQAQNQRMRLHDEMTADGIRIIDDCYNANPDSMHSAIALLSELEADRKVAVLGDMLELGEISEAEHAKIGAAVAAAHIDLLVTVGSEAASVADAAMCKGMAKDRVHHSHNAESATRFLINRLRPGDAVLIKASRGMHFEAIVDGITL